MKMWIAASVALAVSMGGLSTATADDAIKDVMKKGHVAPEKGKPTLLDKVKGGKASDDEKKELVELYEALVKGKPPKGDEEAFKKKADTLLAAAKGVAEGTKGANLKLTAASNCGACHKAHK